MNAWLLTWNPLRGSGAELPGEARKVQNGQRVRDTWSCGVTKSINVRDRVFLARLGAEPRGMIGSGFATSPPWKGRPWRWKESRTPALYVDLIWDALVDSDPASPRFQQPLALRELQRGSLRSMNWTTRASGITIPAEVLPELERRWKAHYERATGKEPLENLAIAASADEEGDDGPSGLEGQRYRVFVWHWRRERRLRHLKIRNALAATGRLQCEVPGCGFDFERTYGSLGLGFAEVHHLKALSSRKKPEQTPLTELAIVCANCHRMIHKDGECRSLSGLIPRRNRTTGQGRRVQVR